MSSEFYQPKQRRYSTGPPVERDTTSSSQPMSSRFSGPTIESSFRLSTLVVPNNERGLSRAPSSLSGSFGSRQWPMLCGDNSLQGLDLSNIPPPSPSNDNVTGRTHFHSQYHYGNAPSRDIRIHPSQQSFPVSPHGYVNVTPSLSPRRLSERYSVTLAEQRNNRSLESSLQPGNIVAGLYRDPSFYRRSQPPQQQQLPAHHPTGPANTFRSLRSSGSFHIQPQSQRCNDSHILNKDPHEITMTIPLTPPSPPTPPPRFHTLEPGVDTFVWSKKCLETNTMTTVGDISVFLGIPMDLPGNERVRGKMNLSLHEVQCCQCYERSRASKYVVCFLCPRCNAVSPTTNVHSLFSASSNNHITAAMDSTTKRVTMPIPSSSQASVTP